ncbi:hypothetical protein THAOC_07231 [Thalassiosira oceanica]|uniref:DUF6743 domain-containing protein n=1 Tax=Thalassiosira oceanica TaxID=159749 RepID=K0T2F4_THAOC|nr:hypothetical protein THAOC_07231 [Thalassiosira oceanica]|eukprot:EJK71344.1 hypothetical protein THAOC_07231 [Thalassiosira oceanica]
MWTSKEWMREDTWHFEVEVLRIYGRQELWSHGLAHARFQTAPTILSPVGAADVRRRVAFGAPQDNEFAVRHCCVHRLRWSVVSGTASSASQRYLEVVGFLRSIGRNKLFSHPPIPGFVTGNWLNLALPCWILALSWKWISFQLTCFTLLVAGRKPLQGHTWQRWRPGRASTGASCVGLPRSSWAACLTAVAPSISRAHVHSTRLVRLSATVRLHASVGKKDGHTFAPNEVMKLDCQDLSGLVLTRCRLFKSVYVIILIIC